MLVLVRGTLNRRGPVLTVQLSSDEETNLDFTDEDTNLPYMFYFSDKRCDYDKQKMLFCW